MRVQIIFSVSLLLLGLLAAVSLPGRSAATLCFYTGERTSGTNKLCSYDCAGSEAVITLKAYEVCPTTINR